MKSIPPPLSAVDAADPDGFPIRNWDGVLVVSPPPEVDFGNSEELRYALLTAIGRAPAGRGAIVVVNLSSTVFFDVTALDVLASVSRRLRESGGELRVAGPSPLTRRCITILGDDRSYRLFATLPGALVARKSTLADYMRKVGGHLSAAPACSRLSAPSARGIASPRPGTPAATGRRHARTSHGWGAGNAWGVPWTGPSQVPQGS